jgi:hypothetical protein
MTSTSSLIAINFFQQIQDAFTKEAVSMLRTIIKALWPTVWPYVLIFVLFVAIVKILSGRIGSLIYNIIYFGILFLIIAIWGLEILFSPYFDVIYALLYPVSYFLTGLIHKKARSR